MNSRSQEIKEKKSAQTLCLDQHKNHSLFFWVLFLFLALTFYGCGNDQSLPVTTQSGDPQLSSVIIGKTDWLQVSELAKESKEVINSQFVAELQIPGSMAGQGSRCTGFLINDSVIMTNHHCIPNAKYALGVSATFDDGVDENGVSKSARFRCSEFLGSNQALDFALIGCQGTPGSSRGHAILDARVQADKSDLYVIQINCDYYLDPACVEKKLIAHGQLGLTDKKDLNFSHNADTLGGSSGSPVFSAQSHSVIGLHNMGYEAFGAGRGTVNFAVPMLAIIKALVTQYPSIEFTVVEETPTPSAEIETDSFEPNDDLASATDLSDQLFNEESEKINVIQIDNQAISTGEDRDFYSLNLPHPQSLKIHLAFKHAEGDLDIYLLDASGKILKQSAGSKNDENLRATLKAGRYVVMVKGFRNAKASYSLKIQ